MKQRYTLIVSTDKKYADVRGGRSDKDHTEDVIRVLTDYSSAQYRRGRSLAKHIQSLLNEHPHEWPKKRGKKSEGA